VKGRPKFADCLHCRRAVPTFDYFMLREEVWLLVHTTIRGMMHLECVEERLGRTLRRTDFATQERLNGMMCHLSPLLRSRYSPSRQELRRGAADFVALLAKHEDVLIRLLKRFHLHDAGRVHGWGVPFEVLPSNSRAALLFGFLRDAESRLTRNLTKWFCDDLRLL